MYITFITLFSLKPRNIFSKSIFEFLRFFIGLSCSLLSLLFIKWERTPLWNKTYSIIFCGLWFDKLREDWAPHKQHRCFILLLIEPINCLCIGQYNKCWLKKCTSLCSKVYFYEWLMSLATPVRALCVFRYFLAQAGQFKRKKREKKSPKYPKISACVFKMSQLDNYSNQKCIMYLLYTICYSKKANTYIIIWIVDLATCAL